LPDNNTPVVCRVCGRAHPMRDIKFDENRKQYVCRNCLSKSQPMTFEEKTDTFTDEKTVKDILSKMVKYNCPKCKYHFQRPEGKEVRECPYCGNRNIERASKDRASKILQESSDWE